ncbi:hypothetical protein ACIJYF_04110 [Candidatus Pelagibacter bacterium nBUS_49]|uniref:hypothetical protein n=1 Tax=Candidatus Pelagibacter bacterium nBUS_49 TaxID=3374196 RepID=UPI003EB7F790
MNKLLHSKTGKLLSSLLKKKLKNIRNIKPILTFPDGCKYSGMTRKDPKNKKKLIAEGLGYAIWPDGQYYEGQYKKGLFHGWGKYTSPGSHILSGIWKNNFLTEGEMRWSDGRHYFGKFKKSKYHGKGSMNYSGNILYVGNWKDNLADGKGKLTVLKSNEHDKKGTILIGKFKKGTQQGKFEKILPNGSIMDCIFVNGVCTKAKWKNDKKWTFFK